MEKDLGNFEIGKYFDALVVDPFAHGKNNYLLVIDY